MSEQAKDTGVYQQTKTYNVDRMAEDFNRRWKALNGCLPEESMTHSYVADYARILDREGYRAEPLKDSFNSPAPDVKKTPEILTDPQDMHSEQTDDPELDALLVTHARAHRAHLDNLRRASALEEYATARQAIHAHFKAVLQRARGEERNAWCAAVCTAATPCDMCLAIQNVARANLDQSDTKL